MTLPVSTPINPSQKTQPQTQTPNPTQTQGGRVLDLGCVPGAWLQVACQQIGPRDRGGLVLGVDLQEVKVPPRFCDDRVKVVQADARLMTPEMLTEYTTDVGVGGWVWVAVCVCVCVGGWVGSGVGVGVWVCGCAGHDYL